MTLYCFHLAALTRPAPHPSWAAGWRSSRGTPRTSPWAPSARAQPLSLTSTPPSVCRAPSPASRATRATPPGPGARCVVTRTARTPRVPPSCITPTWPPPGCGCPRAISSCSRLTSWPASEPRGPGRVLRGLCRPPPPSPPPPCQPPPPWAQVTSLSLLRSYQDNTLCHRWALHL